MKRLLILLLPLTLFAAKVDYSLSAGYIYDSNIGQNTNEVGKGYFVPEGYLKLNGEKTPLFAKVATVYENYLTERSPVLNSPFLTFSGGAELGNKKFSYDTEIRAALYFGQSAQDRVEGGQEPVSWAPAKNSYRWYNDFQLKLKKRHRLILGTQMQINDYGEDGKDGFRLILEPEYQYRIRSKKSVRFTKLALLPEYEGNFVKEDQYGYHYLAIGAGAGMKFWKTSLNLSLSYATKQFHGWIAHPHTGEMLDVSNSYFYTSGSYTVPLVADLSLRLHGKLRFKDSNNPGYAWNRHTVGAKLVWSSTIGKYRRGSSSSMKEEREDREEM